MAKKENLVDQFRTTPTCFSIFLIVFLTFTTLTAAAESSIDLTTDLASRNHENDVKVKNIRSSEQNLSLNTRIDVHDDHYQMSFVDWLKYVLVDVKYIIEIIVNYLCHKPGFEVLDYSEMMTNPDLTLTTDRLLTKYGYSSKSHTVVTKDGYVLKMFQILGRTDKPMKSGKPAVLICHGILSSSDDWLLLGPERSLGYLLSDAGYDVWLYNQRGNFYSRANMYMSPDEPEFWNFTWHELGVYDLPAVIDYILHVTGQEQIIFIGYAQGTTTFFVMLSERPEYNEKIRLAILYAAVAYMRHAPTPTLNTVAYIALPLYDIYTTFHTPEILARESIETKIMRKVCLSKSFLQVLCYGLVDYATTGYDGTEVDKPLFPTFLYHTPAGMSLKQIVHYSQSVMKHTFRQFDYLSAAENEKNYGQPEPPCYNLNNTKVPVTLFYGKHDTVAYSEDIFDLSRLLPNVTLVYGIPVDMINNTHNSINHLDFIWGRDAKQIIYSKTIELLNNAMMKNNR